jgi:hypothetical protein
MHQGEGAANGGGLLRYNTRTGVVTKIALTGYIFTIDRVGDTVYCGTEDGVYLVKGGRVRHLSFLPDRGRKMVLK